MKGTSSFDHFKSVLAIKYKHYISESISEQFLNKHRSHTFMITCKSGCQGNSTTVKLRVCDSMCLWSASRPNQQPVASHSHITPAADHSPLLTFFQQNITMTTQALISNFHGNAELIVSNWTTCQITASHPFNEKNKHCKAMTRQVKTVCDMEVLYHDYILKWPFFLSLSAIIMISVNQPLTVSKRQSVRKTSHKSSRKILLIWHFVWKMAVILPIVRQEWHSWEDDQALD